jgi:flagellar motility protein MotE (MotC chaperone)
MKPSLFSLLEGALKPILLGFVGLCVLTLGLRMLSFGNPDHRLNVAWAEESTPPPSKTPAPTDAKTKAKPDTTTEITPKTTKPNAPQTDLTVREGQPDFAKPEKTDEDLIDLTNFSKSEIELLQSLRERRAVLDQKTQELDQRERTLLAMEASLETKIKTMESIKGDIETIYKNIAAKVAELHQSQDKQIASLVRIYEKMKPENAASIMNNLDLTILLDVVRGMQENKLAPILAKMDVKKATFVTAALAEKTPVPEDAKTLMTSMNDPKAKPQGQ